MELESQKSRSHSLIKLKIKKLENFKGEMPRYQSIGASGFDIRAQLSEKIVLKPLERALIPTGLAMEIPLGYEIQVRPRSGLAAKLGLGVLNSPGTIDADYRGEVKVIVINLSNSEITIEDQERCAQCVLCPILQSELEIVTELGSTERGAGGFGSTGKN
jgi:dUTP pyrophosphatase